MVENIHPAARRAGTAPAYSIARSLPRRRPRSIGPIVYAVAIIVAGFLPIYALSGPSGRLFRPMADTTIFALIGALPLTLTLLPVLCALFLREGSASAATPCSSRCARLRRALDWCLARPRATVGASVGLFGVSLLLATASVPSSCPTWTRVRCGCAPPCPHHLARGIRRRSSPSFARILRSFPEVTVVASEHGRPDDGTNPIGFFNAEFYVGLKPYGEWHGAYHTKAELIAAMNAKLSVFPGSASTTPSPPKMPWTRRRPD